MKTVTFSKIYNLIQISHKKLTIYMTKKVITLKCARLHLKNTGFSKHFDISFNL